jgi:hypothetical protein
LGEPNLFPSLPGSLFLWISPYFPYYSPGFMGASLLGSLGFSLSGKTAFLVSQGEREEGKEGAGQAPLSFKDCDYGLFM